MEQHMKQIDPAILAEQKAYKASKESFRAAIKTLACSQVEAKIQRKENFPTGAGGFPIHRTMEPAMAASTHRLNRWELRHLHIAYALFRGKTVPECYYVLAHGTGTVTVARADGKPISNTENAPNPTLILKLLNRHVQKSTTKYPTQCIPTTEIFPRWVRGGSFDHYLRLTDSGHYNIRASECGIHWQNIDGQGVPAETYRELTPEERAFILSEPFTKLPSREEASKGVTQHFADTFGKTGTLPLDTPIDRELLANAFNVNDFVRVSYWPDQVQGLRYSRHFDLTGHYRVSACVKSTVMVEDKYGERVQVPVKYLTKVYNASPIDTYYPPKPEECNLPDLHKKKPTSTFDTQMNTTKSFIAQFVALIKGEDAEAKAQKVWRQAESAFKTQISALEGKTLDLEEKIVEAHEAEELTILNRGEKINDRDDYITRVLEAGNRVLDAEEAMVAHKRKIDFLQKKLDQLRTVDATPA